MLTSLCDVTLYGNVSKTPPLQGEDSLLWNWGGVGGGTHSRQQDFNRSPWEIGSSLSPWTRIFSGLSSCGPYSEPSTTRKDCCYSGTKHSFFLVSEVIWMLSPHTDFCLFVTLHKCTTVYYYTTLDFTDLGTAACTNHKDICESAWVSKSLSSLDY